MEEYDTIIKILKEIRDAIYELNQDTNNPIQ